MWNTFVDLCGWLPAIIFPTGSIIQLVKIVRARTAQGVSLTTWALFALANIATYIYIEKYFEWQSVGFLIAAFAQIGIIVVALKMRRGRLKELEV